MSEKSVPAGWYPNPSGGNNARWWDGAKWTDDIHSIPEGLSAPEDLTPIVENGQKGPPAHTENETEERWAGPDPEQELWAEAFLRYSEGTSFPDPEDRRPKWLKEKIEQEKRRRRD